MSETTLEAPEIAQEAIPDRPKRKLAPGMDQTGKPAVNALDAPWHDIRDAVATGLSMAKVAKQFAEYHPNGWEPLHHIIRKRAQREGWLVPESAMAKARERLAESGRGVSEASQTRVPAPRDPQKTETLVVQSLAEMGENGSILGGKLMFDLLKKASLKPQKIAPLVDVKDILTATKGLRLVAGMDKQGPQIALNLWSGTPNVPVSVPTEVRDIVECDDE